MKIMAKETSIKTMVMTIKLIALIFTIRVEKPVTNNAYTALKSYASNEQKDATVPVNCCLLYMGCMNSNNT